MPKTTLTRKELSEDDFWSEGSFIGSVSAEEMNYNSKTIKWR